MNKRYKWVESAHLLSPFTKNNYSIMGRMKYYAEEAETPGTGFEFREKVFTRKKRGKKGQSVNTSSKTAHTGEATLDVLLSQVRERIMRSWRSFSHRFHMYTFGLFRKKAVLKVVGLCAIAILIFKTDVVVSKESRASIFDASAKNVGLDLSNNASSKTLNLQDANSAAPIAASGLSQAMADSYIKRFAPVAIAEMRKYGIPASISLAQGLVESRGGTSTLAKKNNNHFGIKCFSKKCRKGHCTNHTDDTHKDFFRKFESPWASWRAHSQILMSARYRNLQAHGKDYKKWAKGLKTNGYATDRRYDAKLIGMIERFNLQRFDKE